MLYGLPDAVLNGTNPVTHCTTISKTVRCTKRSIDSNTNNFVGNNGGTCNRNSKCFNDILEDVHWDDHFGITHNSPFGCANHHG